MSGGNTTWHADDAMLRDYQAGTLGYAHAASVEAHLAACADCRATIARLADRSRLDRSWAGIADRLDGPSAPWPVRLLVRLGISDHRARLVMMTPSFRNPALGSMIAVLVLFSLLSAFDPGDSGNVYAFLVFAPLVPLAGVAAAFGARDPARDIVAATPTPAFELLLVRTLAIVATTTVLTTVAAAPMAHDWQAAAWLLPSMGLTAAVLALATWMPVHVAGLGLGGTWTLAALVSWRINRFDPDVLERFIVLRPVGQLLFAAVTVAGAVIVVLRREALDLRRFA